MSGEPPLGWKVTGSSARVPPYTAQPMESPASPGWEEMSVTGALIGRYRQDQQSLLEQLAVLLESALPGQVTVSRKGGLFGPKRVAGLSVEAGGYRYSLQQGRGDALEAGRQQVVRGVVLRTDELPVERWLEELGTALDAELRRTSQGREALSRLLAG